MNWSMKSSSPAWAKLTRPLFTSSWVKVWLSTSVVPLSRTLPLDGRLCRRYSNCAGGLSVSVVASIALVSVTVADSSRLTACVPPTTGVALFGALAGGAAGAGVTVLVTLMVKVLTVSGLPCAAVL